MDNTAIGLIILGAPILAYGVFLLIGGVYAAFSEGPKYGAIAIAALAWIGTGFWFLLS